MYIRSDEKLGKGLKKKGEMKRVRGEEATNRLK